MSNTDSSTPPGEAGDGLTLPFGFWEGMSAIVASFGEEMDSVGTLGLLPPLPTTRGGRVEEEASIDKRDGGGKRSRRTEEARFPLLHHESSVSSSLSSKITANHIKKKRSNSTKILRP